jgi:magnesium transporter
VTLLPLTVLTGLFGMNVAFPGEGTREAFWVVLALLLGTLIVMVGFFRWRRWL